MDGSEELSLQRPGPYKNGEEAAGADSLLRKNLTLRLDNTLGTLEWIKMDLRKKGGHKQAERVDRISVKVEKVSRSILQGDRAESSLLRGDENLDGLERLFNLDGSLDETLCRIEEQINAMAGERAVPDSEGVEKTLKLVEEMEKLLHRRELLFRGPRSS